MPGLSLGVGIGVSGSGAGIVTAESLPTTASINFGSTTVNFSTAVPYKMAVGGNIVFVETGTIVSSYTPAQSTDAGEVIHGSALNPKYGTDVQQDDVVVPTNWDGRSVYSSEDGTQPTYPLTLANNDILIIAKSNTAVNPDTGSNYRYGVVEDYCVVIAMDSIPVGDEVLAPYLIGQSDGLRSDFTTHTVDITAWLATLPNYTLTQNLPTVADVKTFVDKLNLGPAISYLDSYNAANERAAYEMWSPANSGVENGSNYGEGQSSRMDAAMLYLCLDEFHISAADKEILAARIIQLGKLWYEQCKGVNKAYNEGGGHFQWQLGPIVAYLTATSQTGELANVIDNIKGSFSMPFKVTSAQATYANAPHDSNDQFCFTRRRSVTGVSGLDIEVFADDVGAGSDIGGDPAQSVFTGLRLIRESDGAEAVITNTDDGGGLSDQRTTLTIDAQPTPAFATNDVVYMQPNGWSVAVDDYDWAVRSSRNHATYIANAGASYRSLNNYSAQAMFVKMCLKAAGQSDGVYEALFGYVQRANDSTTDPTAAEDYPTLHTAFTAVGGGNISFVQTYWEELSGFIFSAPDTTAPVVSSPVISGIGEFNATYDANISEDNGIVYILVNQSATLSGDVATQRATIKAGGGDFSDNYLVQGSDTAVNFTISGLPTNDTQYYAHVYMRDAAGNESAIVTTTFTTSAGAAAGYSITYIGGYEDTGNGPYTFSNVPIGSFVAGRKVYAFVSVRSGITNPQTVEFDGTVGTVREKTTFGPDTTQYAAIWEGEPLGSTCNIEIVGGGGTRAGLMVYVVNGAQIDTTGTNVNTSDDDFTINVPNADSDVIAYSMATAGAGTDNFTGFTMDLTATEIESGIYHMGGQAASGVDATFDVNRDVFRANMHTVAIVFSEAP